MLVRFLPRLKRKAIVAGASTKKLSLRGYVKGRSALCLTALRAPAHWVFGTFRGVKGSSKNRKEH